MKKASILTRLLFILVVSVICGALAANIIVSRRIQKALEEELNDEAFLILQSLDWAMRPLIEANKEEEIQRLIDNIAAYPVVEVLRLYDQNEQILFSSDKKESGIVIHNGCVQDIIINKSIMKFYESISEGVYEAALPVKGSAYSAEKGTDIQAIIYLKIDMDYALSNWQRLNQDFQMVFAMVSVFLIFLVGFYIYFVVGKPLMRFKEASEAITKKNYDHKIKGKMSGEFYELEHAFNQMSQSIRAYIDEADDAKRAAEEASEAKMVFITNMSHEIRTPLNSIIGFTQLLAEEEKDYDKKKQLEIVHHSGQHLLAVINDLLDFSKLDSNQMKVENIEFNIKKLIHETGDFFLLQLEKKGLAFQYKIDETVPTFIESDLNKVRQILINLINNAIKFTHHGGIDVDVMFDGEMLQIDVSDTGIGIPEEKRKLIFDAFAQTDNSIARKYGGSGLGLSISQKFAQMLGGSITVSSVVGEGSRFSVLLKVKAIDSDEVDGHVLLNEWLEADLELSDLVYETILSMKSRLKKMEEDLMLHHLSNLQSEVHALKGLTGNFQMNELFELFDQFNKSIAGLDRVNEEQWTEYKSYYQYIKRIHESVYEATEDMNLDNVFEEVNLANDSSKINVRILVAEDIYENRMLIEKMLSKFPINLIFAKDGIEAMAILRNMYVDAMLLDIQMPNMSGEDVLRALANQSKDYGINYKPYIIVLTAHASLEEKNKCMAMGADDYLTKPIQKETLYEKIEEIIGKTPS